LKIVNDYIKDMNRSKILLGILFSLAFLFFSGKMHYAQEDVRISRRAFKKDEQAGFKTAWKSLRKGDKYYDKGKNYYNKALKRFLEAYRYNQHNAALNYKIGVCNFQSGKQEKAQEFFNKALAENELIADDVYYLLARSYHLTEDFQPAIQNYQRSLESDIIDELKIKRSKIDVYLRQCASGKELVKHPIRVHIENMGRQINSAYDDYGSVFLGDSIMYFTSRRKHEKNDDRWPGDNNFYSDIFRAERQDGEWNRAKLISGKIYSKHNDAIVEATLDPLRIYVYQGHQDAGDIFYYEHNGKRWKGPKNLSSLVNTKAKETSMCLTNNGSKLYFVSDLDEDAFGKKDIFYSQKNEKGKWTYPENLGSLINTSLNEEGVFVNEADNKMYFSSEGHNSMGGYDIFVSEKGADGNWQAAKNIGYPVSTTYDDLLFSIMDEENNTAYYSTVKADSYGKSDIYKIVFLGEERDYNFSPALDPIAWKANPRKNLFYRKPQKLSIDTSVYLTGIISDTLYDEGIQAKIEIIDNQKNKIVATHISDTNGHYLISLTERKQYGVEITAQGYLFFAQNLDLNELTMRNDTIKKHFVLNKVEIGKKVVLENIYFETNSATLKTSSYPELERVVRMMQDNPGIKLEISGHTDNIGSYLANKQLSENRAKSVVDYLVEQGIDKSRFTYKGYAFTDPIAPNDTPEGRQKNRRVEFEVLEK